MTAQEFADAIKPFELSIEHNAHNGRYASIDEYLESLWIGDGSDAGIDDLCDVAELEKIQAAKNVWHVQVFPRNGIGSFSSVGSTLDAALQFIFDSVKEYIEAFSPPNGDETVCNLPANSPYVSMTDKREDLQPTPLGRALEVHERSVILGIGNWNGTHAGRYEFEIRPGEKINVGDMICLHHDGTISCADKTYERDADGNYKRI